MRAFRPFARRLMDWTGMGTRTWSSSRVQRVNYMLQWGNRVEGVGSECSLFADTFESRLRRLITSQWANVLKRKVKAPFSLYKDTRVQTISTRVLILPCKSTSSLLFTCRPGAYKSGGIEKARRVTSAGLRGFPGITAFITLQLTSLRPDWYVRQTGRQV